MPNLPPGVASMLHHPQYMATGLAPAAFYGLQQPMYGAYGQTAGFDDIAALQRATASAAGLHTLVGSAAAAQAAQQQPPPAHHSAATANALQSAMKGVCKLRKEQSIKKDNYFRFRPLFYFWYIFFFRQIEIFLWMQFFIKNKKCQTYGEKKTEYFSPTYLFQKKNSQKAFFHKIE